MKKSRDILLIGSADRAAAALSSQIRKMGYNPVQIAEVKDARKHVAGNAHALVVVLLGESPNALDAIREVAFLFRGYPVFAADSASSVTMARESIEAGAAEYLPLPVEDNTLQTLIKHYGDQFFDPELGRGRHLISGDEGMRRLLAQVRRVAQSTATVLIQGESGTGKELIARYVHQVSNRAEGPFVAINCAALPENLLESELFGHAKGAFTGATADRKGKFQQANNGTIFLDEISEMSLPLQAKLLRVLQEGEVDPVGGKKPISLDVRVIASTNRDLKSWSEEGNFREDLFYRLNVFPVRLPPLRERSKDVILLAEHFRKRFISEFARNEIPFSDEALLRLKGYAWPGNIRELENTIQRALLMAEGDSINPEDLMIESALDGDVAASEDLSLDGIRMPVGTTVRKMEEILIRHTLDEVDGNRTRAAELLGISIRTLRNKLNEYAARAETA